MTDSKFLSNEKVNTEEMNLSEEEEITNVAAIIEEDDDEDANSAEYVESWKKNIPYLVSIMEKYHSGDIEDKRAASEDMIKYLSNFVRNKIHRRYKAYSLKHYEDLFQSGCLGICEGMLKYNPEKSSPTTWFNNYIVNQMQIFVNNTINRTTPHYSDLITKIRRIMDERSKKGLSTTAEDLIVELGDVSNTTVNKCLAIMNCTDNEQYYEDENYLDTQITDFEKSPETTFIDEERKSIIAKAVSKLKDDEKIVTILYYGLIDDYEEFSLADIISVNGFTKEEILRAKGYSEEFIFEQKGFSHNSILKIKELSEKEYEVIQKMDGKTDSFTDNDIKIIISLISKLNLTSKVDKMQSAQIKLSNVFSKLDNTNNLTKTEKALLYKIFKMIKRKIDITSRKNCEKKNFIDKLLIADGYAEHELEDIKAGIKIDKELSAPFEMTLRQMLYARQFHDDDIEKLYAGGGLSTAKVSMLTSIPKSHIRKIRSQANRNLKYILKKEYFDNVSETKEKSMLSDDEIPCICPDYVDNIMDDLINLNLDDDLDSDFD